jgi:hypothetical protein
MVPGYDMAAEYNRALLGNKLHRQNRGGMVIGSLK